MTHNVDSAVGVPIGQTLLINTLTTQISRDTQAIPVQAVIQAGATGLSNLTTDPVILNILRMAYSSAVTNVLYLSTAAIAIALPSALCMEWRNVRKEGQKRMTVKTEETRVNEDTTAVELGRNDIAEANC